VPYRTRDYSPPPFPAPKPEHKDWPSEGPLVGGAPLFLRVLKEELIPLIDRRYRTTTDRGIHGHSIGGLFVAYALVTEPDLFARYAITSPALWWDGGSIFLREAEFAKRRTSLRKHVFLSVGGLEGAGEIAAVWRMVSTLCHDRDAGRFVGLKLTAELIPDEYHGSAVPFSRALKALYPPYRADSSLARDPCDGR
jgi:predicted alpha/beta superfamily hydrolase